MSPYFLINLLTLPCACEHKVSVNNVSDALIQATKKRTREQVLEERCRRLETEVAYLKKLRALVEKDEL